MMKSKKNLILKIAIAVFTFGIGITTLFSVKVNADTSNILIVSTIINPNDVISTPNLDLVSKEYGFTNGFFAYNPEYGGFYYDGMPGWNDLWLKENNVLTYIGTSPIEVTSVSGEGIDLLLNESTQPETPSEINSIYKGTRDLAQKLIFGDMELTSSQEGLLDYLALFVTLFVFLLPFILVVMFTKKILEP